MEPEEPLPTTAAFSTVCVGHCSETGDDLIDIASFHLDEPDVHPRKVIFHLRVMLLIFGVRSGLFVPG